MKLTTSPILLILFIFLSFNSFSQVHDIIYGTVTAEDGSTVPGVTVRIYCIAPIKYRIKSDNSVKFIEINGTITDIDGNYKLIVPDSLEHYKIEYSFMGLETKIIEIPACSKKNKNKFFKNEND